MKNKNLDRSHGDTESFKAKKIRGRLARWFMTLQEQEYEVSFEFIPGKKNTAADAHSRNIKTDESTQTSTILCNLVELIALDEDLVRTEQRKEEPWKGIINYLEKHNSRSTKVTRKS